VRERLDVERVRLAAGLCDGLDPLHAPLSKVSGCSEGEGESEARDETDLCRVGHHHVAVHEHVVDGLVDAGEDGCAHGDVGDKVAVHDICKGDEPSQCGS